MGERTHAVRKGPLRPAMICSQGVSPWGVGDDSAGAYTFLNGAQSTANLLVHRMSGTPSIVAPERTSLRVFSTQKPGRMHEW